MTNHHGVHFLDIKHKKLTINKSNKNDIVKLLGPPSTSSTFDESLIIYIERSTSSSKLTKLGKKTLLKNNVLILDLDNKGILVEKIFLDKDKMLKVDFSQEFTTMDFTKKSFVYKFLTGMRQKVNDLLGQKRKRIKTN